MRILRLTGGAWSVELHPYVTVVSGLSDEQRAEVAAAFQGAIRGRTTGLGGLMEVHGVVLDLDDDSLALLDLEDVEVDAIVEPTDLPGAASAGLDRQLRTAERRLETLEVPYRERGRSAEAAQAALDDARAAVDAARSALDEAGSDDQPDEELGRLEGVLADAERALEQLADPGSRAAGELEQAERELAEVVGDDADGQVVELAAARRALEARRSRLLAAVDPNAADAFEAALEQLRTLEAAAAAEPVRPEPEPELEPEPEPEPDPDPDPDSAPRTPLGLGMPRPAPRIDGGGTAADLAPSDHAPDAPAEDAGQEAGGTDRDPDEVATRIEELHGVLALHASFDPDQLRSALDAIRLTPSVGELIPSPEALSLADRLEAIDRQVAELEAGAADAPVPGEVEAAAARLDEIRSEIIELERTSAPSNLDADIEELERAHEEVVEARERLEGRIGRGRAQTRYEEAVAAEEAVLDRLGIRSYTDYLTGGRAALYADAEPAELRDLRRRERAAEAELRALEERAQRAIDVAAAGQDRRELRGRARTLLGDTTLEDHELTRALLALRVPAETSSPLDELLDALDGVGLPVRSLDLSRDDAEAMAADWLDEYYRAEDRRAALEEELAALESGSPLPADAPVEIVPEVPLAAPVAPPTPLAPVATPLEAPADGDLAEQVAAAQALVREAKDRMIAHESAMRELSELDIELEAVEGEERQTEQVRLRIEAAEQRVELARSAARSLDEQRAAAEARVVEARAALEQHRAAPPARVAQATAALEAAERELARAEEAAHAAGADLDAARAGYDAAVEEVAALRQALTDVAGEAAPVEEIEWYLLARLAAQRQVSFAGSVPIVVDRALDSVDDAGVVHLLERLERMAGAVQVVHLTDDERIMRWASESGEDRVAVVRPAVPSAVD